MGGISPTICYSEWKFTAGALVQFARVWLVIFNCMVSLDHYVLHACIKVCIVSVTTLTCMHIIMWSFPNWKFFIPPGRSLRMYIAGLEAKWSAWVCTYAGMGVLPHMSLYWITIKISCFYQLGQHFQGLVPAQSVRQQSSCCPTCTWETWDSPGTFSGW